MRFLLLTTIWMTAAMAWGQADTLWIVSGGWAFGGDTLAALRFASSPQFDPVNARVSADAPLVVVNLDSVSHELNTTIEGWQVVTAGANEAVELIWPSLSNETHRLWSDSERGQTLGLSTMIRSGWDDHPHFLWNLNEWEPGHTWTVAAGDPLDEAAPYVPTQFTINESIFPATLDDSTAVVTGNVGDTLRVSVVNHGRMDQVLHFHGYHVTVLQSSQHPNRVGWSKDTVPVKRGECVVVSLTPHQPGMFPVHAHNLIAVTNGGFYPGGMLTRLIIEE